MAILADIYEVIKKNTVLGERAYETDINANLLDCGLDSLQMIRVIVELEQMLGIEFDDEDLLMANFGTIKSIMEFIETVQAQRGISVSGV